MQEQSWDVIVRVEAADMLVEYRRGTRWPESVNGILPECSVIVTELQITDTESGSSVTLNPTEQQAGAILALLVAGDDGWGRPELPAMLYQLAEPAVEHLPAELRPIP